MAEGEAVAARESMDVGDVLYRHTTRPQWGRAVLAWMRDTKQGFQFEDGKLRVIGTEYLHLLEERPVDGDAERRLVVALRRKAGWKEQPQPKRRAGAAVAVPVERQVELFARQYPKGFSGARWGKEMRGIDAMRRLQRHRDPAIAEARRLLARERLEPLARVGKHQLVVDALREVCEGTSLVSRAQASVLEKVSEGAAEEVSARLIDLLYGEEAFGIRFERFVDTLTRATGKKPTWPLATAPLCLVHPEEHICIKPASMKRQVACAGRHIQVSSIPSAPVYERLRLMVEAIRSQLATAGTPPRDLVDVYDFIEITTTPKALRQMKAEEDRVAA